MSRRVALVALALLCGVFVVVGLVQADRDAPTVDEGPDVTAGLVAVVRHDVRMVPEHGLLPKVAFALLPALVADPVVPLTDAYDEGEWFDYTDDLISANAAAGRLEGVLFWARVVPVLVGAGVGGLLYAVGSRLGGRRVGLVAAFVWLSTPYTVGLAHFAMVDVAFTFTTALLVLAGMRHLERASAGTTVALGAALLAMVLTRHLGLVLVPVVVAVAVWPWRAVRERAVRVGAAVLVGLLAGVWVAYRLVDPTPVDGAAGDRLDAIVAAGRAEGFAARASLAAPFPSEFRAGLAYLVLTNDERPTFLLGDHWVGNRPWYFPVSALVKAPATAIAALVLGAAVLAGDRRAGRRALIALGPVGGVLAAALMVQSLNLGLRLFMPVLALLAVVAGFAARVSDQRRGAVVLGVLLCGQAVAFGAAHPHSLAWTPPPFTDGYRSVSDSSVDFGQDLFALAERHEASPVAAASIITTRGLRGPPGVPDVVDADLDDLVGTVAVGATRLTVLDFSPLSWLRAYCPVGTIGGSILLYRFTEPPDTTPGPTTPASPCSGDVSLRD